MSYQTKTKYQVVKNGEVTHEWLSSSAGADHYEESFGKPERVISSLDIPKSGEDISLATAQNETTDHEGNAITLYTFPAEYEVVSAQATQKEDPDWISLRNKRAALLSGSDALFYTDRTFSSEEVRAAWVTYRQALRDLPANTVDPTNPSWPVPPA